MKKIFVSILVVMISFNIMTYTHGQQLTLGDQWNLLINTISDAEKAQNANSTSIKLQEAYSIYVDVFKSAAEENDHETDDLIESAFIDMEYDLDERNVLEADLKRGIIDKSINKIAFMKIEQALDDEDASTLLDWYPILKNKFKISENPSLITNQALIEIQTSPDSIGEYSGVIKNELLWIFKQKTTSAIEETLFALNNGNINNTRKAAYDGLYYYRILYPSVGVKIGEEKAQVLLDNLQELVELTSSDLPIDQIKEDAKRISNESELIMIEYDTGSSSDIGIAVTGIKTRVGLINDLYDTSIEEGQLINQEKYDQSTNLITNIIKTFDVNKNKIVSISEADGMLIESNLAQIKQIIESKGNFTDIEPLVIETNDALDTIQNIDETMPYASVAYLTQINDLLDQISYNYRNGNTTTALSLTTSAYLDNYEFVKDDIASQDNALMEKIELMLKDELKNKIQAGASADEIDTQIDSVRQELSVAKTLVPEFGPLVSIVFVIAIISILVIGIKTQKITMFSV